MLRSFETANLLPILDEVVMGAFDNFKGILPYASELFGIYQPLLGWKSKRIAKRYEKFRASLYAELASRALANSRPPVEVKLGDMPSNAGGGLASSFALTVSKLEPLDLSLTIAPRISTTIDSHFFCVSVRGRPDSSVSTMVRSTRSVVCRRVKYACAFE